MKSQDEQFMEIAYHQAQLAYRHDEVPVGCVIVRDNNVIAVSYNQKQKDNLAILHAEMITITRASKLLKTKYLEDCTIYITLEPCMMCMGAIVHARIGRVVFGAYDPKTGCAVSTFNISEFKGVNHHPQIVGGVLENECSELLKSYFKEKRGK